MPEIKILSNKLRALRHELGKTQVEFSAEIGISEDEVSKLECERTDPKLSTLQKIAAYTGMTVSELLAEEATEKEEDKPC